MTLLAVMWLSVHAEEIKMEEILEFLEKFFDTGAFPPRWHCGRWSEFHGWLYIVSDVAIWAAYFAIPLILLRFVRKRKDLPFPKIFWLFGAFILACGLTHLIDAVIFWLPIYRVSAFARFVTAIISWVTILSLYRIIPQALQLRSAKELEREVALRTSELHETIEKMRFMADVMPQIVWTAKPDGTMDYFNKRTQEFTGKAFDELEGWRWSEILHPDDREHTVERWNDALKNKVQFEVENRILSADGLYYWHLTRAVPQMGETGEVICWIGTATNIEQHKKNEEILERKVADRTEELRIANESLLQSNSDLEQFAGFASHDLQAPLRSMTMYMDMLSQRNQAVLDEKSIGYISKAVSAGQRMRNLIETLLTYSKVNSKNAQLAEVDLNGIIDIIRSTITDVYPAQKVALQSHINHTVIADELLMTQLLQNLVANGIKYNSSEVAVVTIATEESAGHILISVTDNGIGIPHKHQDAIFKVFTRLQADMDGTGLGLAISKRVVEKHKGTISVDSEPGRGTTITVAIPKRP
ncbi:ATP-binding protein [Flavobacterium sp. DGU11]|uniref:histidine kinase n=1 Tax=Flavobacterium arundinis TaxID=3139143 RepID=A0ABU9HXX6_9FLAO